MLVSPYSLFKTNAFVFLFFSGMGVAPVTPHGTMKRGRVKNRSEKEAKKPKRGDDAPPDVLNLFLSVWPANFPPYTPDTLKGPYVAAMTEPVARNAYNAGYWEEQYVLDAFTFILLQNPLASGERKYIALPRVLVGDDSNSRELQETLKKMVENEIELAVGVWLYTEKCSNGCENPDENHFGIAVYNRPKKQLLIAHSLPEEEKYVGALESYYQGSIRIACDDEVVVEADLLSLRPSWEGLKICGPIAINEAHKHITGEYIPNSFQMNNRRGVRTMRKKDKLEVLKWMAKSEAELITENNLYFEGDASPGSDYQKAMANMKGYAEWNF